MQLYNDRNRPVPDVRAARPQPYKSQREKQRPPDRREHDRHDAQVKTLLRERVRVLELTTANVSRHGVFLLTDSPRAERQLVQLSFELPDGPLELMGVVARAVLPADGATATPAGMGIEFFLLSRETKVRWDAFIGDLRAGEPDSAQRPEWKRSTAQVSCFLVRMRDRDRLRDYHDHKISSGSVLLWTPAPDEVSKTVEVILVHPDTKAEFLISGRVVQVNQSPSIEQRGVVVQFEKLDLARRKALLSFVETGA